MGFEYRACVLCQGQFVADTNRQELCGRCLKWAGMKAAAENQARKGMLKLMRAEAVNAAREFGEVTIEHAYDKVCARLQKSLMEVVSVLGKAAGSTFMEKRWEFTGKRVNATQNPNNHARELKVWRLAGGGE